TGRHERHQSRRHDSRAMRRAMAVACDSGRMDHSGLRFRLCPLAGRYLGTRGLAPRRTQFDPRLPGAPLGSRGDHEARFCRDERLDLAGTGSCVTGGADRAAQGDARSDRSDLAYGLLDRDVVHERDPQIGASREGLSSGRLAAARRPDSQPRAPCVASCRPVRPLLLYQRGVAEPAPRRDRPFPRARTLYHLHHQGQASQLGLDSGGLLREHENVFQKTALEQAVREVIDPKARLSNPKAADCAHAPHVRGLASFLEIAGDGVLAGLLDAHVTEPGPLDGLCQLARGTHVRSWNVPHSSDQFSKRDLQPATRLSLGRIIGEADAPAGLQHAKRLAQELLARIEMLSALDADDVGERDVGKRQGNRGPVLELETVLEVRPARALARDHHVLPGDVEPGDRAALSFLGKDDVLRSHAASDVQETTLRTEADRSRHMMDKISRGGEVVAGPVLPQTEVQHPAVIVAVFLYPILIEGLDTSFLRSAGPEESSALV